MTTTIDPGLLTSARKLYNRRLDEPEGWQRFRDGHPEIAAAALPAGRGLDPALDEYWDEQEWTHRAVERWAKYQGARKQWSYRDVIQAAQAKNPKSAAPARCWHDEDRGRWNRRPAAAESIDGPGDDDTSDPGSLLLQLDVETAKGWGIENSDATRDGILEVCRLCNAPLDLERDEHGAVKRNRGQQPGYCSKAHKSIVNNAQRRAKTAANSPKRMRPKPKAFDLASVTLAGVGKLEVSPERWNRTPRSEQAVIARRAPEDAPQVPHLPYLHRGSRSSRIGFVEILEVLGMVDDREDRGVAELPDPDVLARRWHDWQSYWPGTGTVDPGYAPTVSRMPTDWDAVATWWRYVDRGQPVPYALTEQSGNSWRIAA